MFDYVTGFSELPALRVPPAEFRVFKVGENETSHGVFVFDGEAAKLVMAAWAKGGVDLMIDYEHQALQEPPVVAPASATKWVPQIRDGELWATNVTWTDRAHGYLSAGEYRYTSPAFSFDEETRRITKVLNLALTNLPATEAQVPLVAASQTKGIKMDFEKAYKESQAMLEQLRGQLASEASKNTELTAKLSQLTQLEEAGKVAAAEQEQIASALGLPAAAKAGETVAAVQALASVRSQLRSITGAESDAQAYGTVHAWRDANRQLATLSSKMADLEQKELNMEFEQLLKAPLEDGSILTPDATKEIRASLSATGGRVTKEAIVMCKTFAKLAPRIKGGFVAKPETKPSTSTVDPIQAHIRKVLGVTEDEAKQ